MNHTFVVVFVSFLLAAFGECSHPEAFFVGLVPIGAEPKDEPKPVALESVDVHANVRAFAVGILANLTYRNTLNETIECQFVFPMADSAAVYKLEALFENNRRISAELRARQEAEQIYQHAVKSGQRAVLLQSQEETADIYRIRLGNLGPGETAKITIGYAQPIDRDSENRALLSLTLPVVLNPRYVPKHEITDAEAMRRNFQTTIPYVAVSEVSYAMKFSATIDMGLDGKILDVKPGHPNDLLAVERDSERVANVELMGNFRQDHDFRLSITTQKSLKPTVYVEPGLKSGDGSGVALSWLDYQVGAAWFDPVTSDQGAKSPDGEYWLIIDRSGSMEGQKIADAREALQLFVRSLPFGCFFNIIGFGSHYEALFRNGVVKYSEDAMKQAIEYGKQVQDDFGGTEILEPLQYVYRQEIKAEAKKRNIILLTDGEVSNTNQVIDLAQRNAGTTRIFAIGIGEGASTALVDGVARVSNGLSDYVRNSGDRLQEKVISVLKAMNLPSAENFGLNWNVSGGEIVAKEPTSLPLTAFLGQSIAQYAIFEVDNGQASVVGSVDMSAKVNGIQADTKMPFEIRVDGSAGDDDSMPLHRLAAKARLVTLADKYRRTKSESDKQEAIAISIASGVLCQFTSYVAVDYETNATVNGSKSQPLFVNVERPSTYDWAKDYYGNLAPQSRPLSPLTLQSLQADEADGSAEQQSPPYLTPKASSADRSGMSGRWMNARVLNSMPMKEAYAYDPCPTCLMSFDRQESHEDLTTPDSSTPSTNPTTSTTTNPSTKALIKTSGNQSLKERISDMASSLFTMLSSFFRNWMQLSNKSNDVSSTYPSTLPTTVKPTKKPTRGRGTIPLAHFVNLQNFDGSWTLSDVKFQTAIASLAPSFDIGKIRKTVQLPSIDTRNESTLFGTLTGITVLRRHFAARRGEWQLIEGKAANFLLLKGALTTQAIDQYVEMIAKILQL